MLDQVINMTMHTLNKYGVPCSDVTEYVNPPSASSASEGSSAVFYLQKNKYTYLIKTKLKPSDIPDIVYPDPFEPVTGIKGYNYCVFHNEPDANWGSKGYISYYSVGSGNLITTVELPHMIANSAYRLKPSFDVNSNLVVYDAVEFEDQRPSYMRFERNVDGSLTPVGQCYAERFMAINDVTYKGMNSDGYTEYKGYGGTVFWNDPNALLPSKYVDNFIYTNNYGEEVQFGDFFKEALPDLSADSSTKRIALSKQSMFVGELAPGPGVTIEVPFSSTLPIGYPNRDGYTFLVTIFDDNFDDGSGLYDIGRYPGSGSGQIQGLYYNNIMFIMLSFDDSRGATGNQAYQKWYNSSGNFLYNWIWPEDEDGNLYSLTGRVNHQNSFFYVAINNTTKDSYLLHYNLLTGSMTKTELINPYKDELYEGGYKVSNLQLIEDKYLMVHTSNGHKIFFDAYNPSQGIKGEILIDSTFSQLGVAGYYIIPQIGDDQPVVTTTNKLLQLCNTLRPLKMTWAANQVSVCQAHADWCVANSVFQHEGPGNNSVGDRNKAAGIYAGVAENIDLVMTSTLNQEQEDAFNDWCVSPHHYQGIIRGGNKFMSFAWATYPESVTQISVAAGMWDGTGYTTEPAIREVQEWERGKLKIYVQNFIWY